MSEISVADFLAMRANDLLRGEANAVWVYEDLDSVRSPGWFQADCIPCDWCTTGTQRNVEDSAFEHAAQQHDAGRAARALHALVKAYRQATDPAVQEALHTVVRTAAGHWDDHEDYNPAWRPT